MIKAVFLSFYGNEEPPPLDYCARSAINNEPAAAQHEDKANPGEKRSER
jgi:hypothetical protein